MNQRLLDEPPTFEERPRISSLVGAWNAEEDLAGFISDFRRIEYSNKELILAVGGAHRAEDVVPLAGDGVTIVENPGGGKNAALAVCLQEATGDILFVTDADSSVSSESFLNLVAPIVSGKEAVTTGASLPFDYQRQNLFIQLQWASRAYEFAHTDAYTERLRGKCYALTRTALEAAGGINVDVLGEDYYLGNRLIQAGYRIRFVPECLVETFHHHSFLGYLSQHSRWQRAVVLDGIRLRRYGEAFGALRGSVLATAVIACTAALPLIRGAGLWWLAFPILRSYLQQTRHLAFARRIGIFRAGPRHYLGALLLVYLDMLASARTLPEYVSKVKRYRW